MTTDGFQNPNATNYPLLHESTKRASHALQGYLLRQRAAHLTWAPAGLEDIAPVAMKVRAERAFRIAVQEEVWLLVPWDGADFADAVGYVKAALFELQAEPAKIVLVTSSLSSNSLSAEEIRTVFGVPMTVVLGRENRAVGDPAVTRTLSRLFDGPAGDQHYAVDLQASMAAARRHSHELAGFAGILNRTTPHTFVTNTLVIANVLVFIIMVLSGVSPTRPTVGQLIAWGANCGPLTTGGQWWRVLSSAFLHIGLLHLLFNMWCLWNLGKVTERLFGNAAFTVVYALSAVGGGLLSIYLKPVIVSAGASGAIFGLCGALVAFLIVRRGVVPASIFKDVMNSSLFFIGFNVLFGFTAQGIDNGAHIGGLITGFVAGAILSRSLPPSGTLRERLRYVGALVIAAALICAAYAARRQVVSPRRTKPSEAQQQYESLLRPALPALQEQMSIREQFDAVRNSPGRFSKDDLKKIYGNLLARARASARTIRGIRTSSEELRALHAILIQRSDKLVAALAAAFASLDSKDQHKSDESEKNLRDFDLLWNRFLTEQRRGARKHDTP